MRTLSLIAATITPLVVALNLGAQSLVGLGERITCVAIPEQAVQCSGEDSELLSAHPSNIISVGRGARHDCIATPDSITCRGIEEVVGPGGERTIPIPAGISQMAVGGFHTCVVDSEGELRCWGDNSFGQLGSGNRTSGPTPAAVKGDLVISSVVSGLVHTCALTSGGNVHCWGDGSYGQLGNGASASSLSPVEITGLSDVSSISAGLYHTCVLTSHGAVQCWGDNRFGQLGDGTATTAPSPVEVQELEGEVVDIAAGGFFTCARMKNGTVSCWGWNDQGQLGDASRTGPELEGKFHVGHRPVVVSGLRNVSDLRAAWGHACATTDRGIECWGRNDAGQLGDGTLTDRAGPVPFREATVPSAPPAPVDVTSRKGLDVSYHSGPVDWVAVRKAGYGFGFTLATAGNDFRDPLLATHMNGMRRGGLIRGAYHFFVAHDDPASQASWFILNAPLEAGDLAPVIDIETLGANPPEDFHQRLRTFASALETHYGVKPIIYTGPVFWEAHGSSSFSDLPLWIAEYGVGEPRVPDTWKTWTFWQWKGDAAIPGVRNADLNRLASDANLESLMIPKAAAQQEGEHP